MNTASSKSPHGQKIAVVGCRDNTKDLIRRLVSWGYKIGHIITISPEDALNKYHISGYCDLSGYAHEMGIPIYFVKDYKLKESSEDRENITALGIDLLIVLGWQRIIPKWVLDGLRIGAIGMHGSPEPPPFGRGHSALNWSLIEGRKRFISYLFFYVPKADAGPIIGTKEFDILPWDNCESLHFKYQHAMGRLLQENLPSVLDGKNRGLPQNNEGASYYPARKPEDGAIFWNNTVDTIYNLIRGITIPYPGAFTYMNGQKITIWSAKPFDTKLTWNASPGTIVEVFYNGKFIVQTRDYALLVDHYEGPKILASDIGQILNLNSAAK